MPQSATSRPSVHLLAALAAVALVAFAATGAASPDAQAAPSGRALVTPGGPVLSAPAPGDGEPLAVVLDPAPPSSPAAAGFAASTADRVGDIVEAGGGAVRHDLSHAGLVAVTADDDTAARLAALPGVAAVIPDEPLRPLGEVPVSPAGSYNPHAALRATSAASGWPSAGAGHTVAILDTGVQSAHPSLAGKVVAAGCFSTNLPSSGITPACAGDTPELLGEPCNFASCNHGTAVAGIAAGRVTPGASHTGGLAPGAVIAAVQVFSKATWPDGCDAGCPLAYSSDVVAALTWLVSIAEDINLASVNLSLGGGPGASTCSTDMGGPAIRQLAALGVPVIAAAGNDGDPHRVSWPACAADVIAVSGASSAAGDTWSSMLVDRYNGGPKIAVAAPGYRVPAPVPGQTAWWLHSGTSFASPAVAGAAAAWRERNPTGGLSQFLPAVTAGTVTDQRTGASYPRLEMAGLYPPPPTTTTAPPTTSTTTTLPPAPPPTTTTTTVPRPAPPNRPALHNFEQAVVSGRSVRLAGWALDPDGGKPKVRVVLNGKAVVSPPVAVRRDEVWNFFGRDVDRNSGWSHISALPAGTHSVCVDIADAGHGNYHSRMCKQVVIK